MNGILHRVSSRDLFAAQYAQYEGTVSQGFRELGSELITGIRAVKIYYCSYGRNAWHSTWVTKYSSGCMHSTFESAKQFIESKRVQGSKFYIEELPAVCLESETSAVLITEINDLRPLHQYSTVARVVEDPRILRLMPLSGYCPTVGQEMFGGMVSLQPGSAHWPVGKSSVNSVITLWASSDMNLHPLETAKLAAWRSMSHGPSYYLQWLPVANEASGAAVLALSRNMAAPCGVT